MPNLYFDNVWAWTDSESLTRAIKADLTTFAPGYKYSKLYKAKRWNGKVSLVNKEGKFPTGLVPWIANRYSVNLIDRRFILPVIDCEQTKVPLREYQWNAVRKSLQNFECGTWWPRGVLAHCTGSGKTLTAAAMIQLVNRPTLFLANREHLVHQASNVFFKYGIPCHALMDEGFAYASHGSGLLENKTIACTVQSLMSWAAERKNKSQWLEQKGKKIVELLDSIEQVFVDEAHQIASSVDKGNQFVQALNLMPKAYMRWGLTATPFLRNEYHDWLLEGTTGQVIDRVTTQELVLKGFLAKATVKMIRMPKLLVKKEWPDCYEAGIVLNEKRNKKAVEIIKDDPELGLILVNRIGHGNIIEQEAKKQNLKIPFISGKDPLETRLKTIKDLRERKINAIVSTVADEGIDIPELKTIIMAGGGKSKIKNTQRGGRGLRITDTKTSVNLYDFLDTYPDSLYKHALERKKTWTSLGFQVIEEKLV